MAKSFKKAEEVTVLGNDAESFRKAFTDHIHHTLARNSATVTDHEKFLATVSWTAGSRRRKPTTRKT